MKKFYEKVIQLSTERVFIMLVGIYCLFAILLLRFYQLQVIQYDDYAKNVRVGVERQIEIPATRGLIFDRYGRPLAINQPTHILKVDQQVSQSSTQLNETLLKVAQLLESNGDTYIDDIPISKTEPFEYTGTKTAINQFMYSIPYNHEEHRQQLLALSAEEVIQYLRGRYYIPESMTNEEARKVIAMRTTMYPYTYQQYKLTTIATGISENTIASVQENYMNFPGVSVGIDSVRYYPEGEYMGNILGYTRVMTDSIYSQLEGQGYDKNDVVGHEGIERSMESELRGQKGLERIEVDTFGRKVHTIEEDAAIQGNDIFLTIDIDLQREVYTAIEKRLSEALVVRLRGQKSAVSAREVLISMIESSQLLVSKMRDAEEGTQQFYLYNSLLFEYNNLDPVIQEELTLQQLLLQWAEEKESIITDKQIILAMHEQGSLSLSPEVVNAIWENPYGGGEAILIQQLQDGHLKPNQMAIDPFSASAVIVDVNTGEVLALVGYPSVDSNELANNFNSYYPTLFDDRSMLWNRAMMTIKAPGSIFKMVSATAGLMEGVVSPNEAIYCSGVFTKAGEPAPKCWIYNSTGGGHGAVTLQRAIEVSCNCYFYEVAYRLGIKNTEAYGGIDALTKYATMFGLDEPTGIELPEASPNVSMPYNLVVQNVTSVLSGLRNMNEERLVSRAKDIGDRFTKSLYPVANANATDIEGRIENLIQYEFKRNIEVVLQGALANDIEKITQKSLENIQGYLQLNLTAVVEDVVVNTMADTSSRSLKAKATEQVTKHIKYMITDTVEDIVEDALDDILPNDILEVYRYAYTTLYNKVVIADQDQELIDALAYKLANMEADTDKYLTMLEQKVAESLVTVIGSYLFEGIDMEWNDGITIRTAIGQGQNAFSPVQMARYTAALANGEVVHDLKIVGAVYDSKETQTLQSTEVKINSTLDIPDEYLEEIYKGMQRVVTGSSGTLRNHFRGIQVDTAGKTGTAQEGKHEHSWYAGFAPVDDPQIVVVTSVYNEDGLGSYGSQIARDIFEIYYNVGQEVEKTTLQYEFLE
ncbi:MAG: hypothetical protein ATN36_06990 [Epulopiscium sp. Nele67-Bin005]|nr:MAG: hypothetical protein ATN36_06990 [Epulopiscium sp. Nele67-Bin005]